MGVPMTFWNSNRYNFVEIRCMPLLQYHILWR